MTRVDSPNCQGVVLIADTDPVSRRRLAVTLSSRGYEVIEQSTLEDVLAIMGSRPVDVVLVDLMDPEMNGIELCRRIRKNLRFGRVPVVFVTGRNDRDFRIKGAESGGDDFLTKPVDDLELVARVRNLVLIGQYNRHVESERASLKTTVEEQTNLLSKAILEIGKAKQTVRKFNEEIIVRLSKAVEFRDDETGNHVHRMSRYCGIIASKMGMSKEMSEAVRIASALHDVGKIAIPDDILRKPGPLTTEEMAVMRRHAEKGYRMLTGSESSLLELAATIAKSHHERYDGTGYPGKLKGENIPLEGRITAVGDVFDALTSSRVYKAAYSVEKAMDILHKEKETGFDPKVVDAFANSYEDIRNVMIVYADR